MIKYLKEYRFYIILFFFILIPIIAIDTSTRSPRDYRFYDRFIVSLTAPVQVVVSWTLETLNSGYQNYLYLWHVRRDNQSLLDENRKLQNQIAILKETQQENIRLRNLLSFREQQKLTAIAARVIAKDVSTEFRALRLNRGSSSGINRDMAVLTELGVVGRVWRVTANSADIVTIMDPLSAVDGIIERSRTRGVIVGKTDTSCQMRYTLRTDDVQVGDTLVSSGLGGIFPKGIPVGTVSKVERKPFGITQDIEVVPSVDFSKLEEVLVVTKLDSELLSQEVLKEEASKASEKKQEPKQ